MAQGKNYVVYTEYRGVDATSEVLARMGGSFDKYTNRARSGLRGITGEAGRAQSALLGLTNNGRAWADVAKGMFAGSILQRGGAMVRDSILGQVKAFAEYDDAVVSTMAKVDFKLDRSSDKFKSVEGAIRKVAQETKYTSVEIANAADVLAQAGLNADTIVKTLPSVTNFALASKMSLSASSTALMDISGAMGMGRTKFEDGAEGDAKFEKALRRVNNTVTKTAIGFNVSTEELYQSVRKAGAIGSILGDNIEQQMAAMGFMSNAGIKGGMEGTTLKNMYTNIAGALSSKGNGDGYGSLLKDIGLSKEDLADAKGNSLGLIKIFEKIGVALEGVSTPKQLRFLDKFFGKYALAGSAVTVNAVQAGEAFKKLKGFQEKLLESNAKEEDASKDIGEALKKGLGYQVDLVKSSFEELSFRIIEAFAGEGSSALLDFTKSLNEFDVRPMVEQIQDVGHALKPLVSAAGFLLKHSSVLLALGATYAGGKIVTGSLMGLAGVGVRASQFASDAGTTSIGGIFAKTQYPVGHPQSPFAGPMSPADAAAWQQRGGAFGDKAMGAMDKRAAFFGAAIGAAQAAVAGVAIGSAITAAFEANERRKERVSNDSQKASSNISALRTKNGEKITKKDLYDASSTVQGMRTNVERLLAPQGFTDMRRFATDTNLYDNAFKRDRKKKWLELEAQDRATGGKIKVRTEDELNKAVTADESSTFYLTNIGQEMLRLKKAQDALKQMVSNKENADSGITKDTSEFFGNYGKMFSGEMSQSVKNLSERMDQGLALDITLNGQSIGIVQATPKGGTGARASAANSVRPPQPEGGFK